VGESFEDLIQGLIPIDLICKILVGCLVFCTDALMRNGDVESAFQLSV